jgi:hypothetical protein
VNEAEQAIADTLYEAIQNQSNYSARSLQAREFRAGVSDLGFCSERVRRMLDQQVPNDTDMLAAWIGTALGDAAEEAALAVWPHCIKQAEVTLTLEGESGRTYSLTGHPDLIDPAGIVIDFKTDYGLSTVERSGPSDQQQYQRHGYAKAAFDAGLFNDDVELHSVKVANVWIDRAAKEKRLHVQMEDYDEGWVADAARWLDDVVYAYLQKEEARKEPPREMCAVVCGFFEVCRAWDTDVEGLIRAEHHLEAIGMYREGMLLEKQGKQLKDEAKVHLEGVNGSTGEFMVRWTTVNESVIPETVRRGYDKLEVRPLKQKKAGK